MKLVICEKPSVAKAVASALGVTSRADGCFEGNGLIVSWCVGHLVSPMDAAGYDPDYKKWRLSLIHILFPRVDIYKAYMESWSSPMM